MAMLIFLTLTTAHTKYTVPSSFYLSIGILHGHAVEMYFYFQVSSPDKDPESRVSSSADINHENPAIA